MDINQIILSPSSKYCTFGILTKPPIKKVYYPNCWNEVLEGEYKDKTFRIYTNYIDGVKGSTVIIYNKLGKWVKSKLKYLQNGKMKTLSCCAKDRKD